MLNIIKNNIYNLFFIYNNIKRKLDFLLNILKSIKLILLIIVNNIN